MSPPEEAVFLTPTMMLRYVLSNPNISVAIPGARYPSRIRENVELVLTYQPSMSPRNGGVRKRRNCCFSPSGMGYCGVAHLSPRSGCAACKPPKFHERIIFNAIVVGNVKMRPAFPRKSVMFLTILICPNTLAKITLTESLVGLAMRFGV